MSPAPSLNQHEISIALASHMFMLVKERSLGKVYTSMVDVYLDEHRKAVQPDIIFVAVKNCSMNKWHSWHARFRC